MRNSRCRTSPCTRRIRVASLFDSMADMVSHQGRRQRSRYPGTSSRARIFEPYFTTKPTGIGAGVGLAVSLGIVEAHGGTLTVDCPIEGGAVFTITLPVGTVERLAPIPNRREADREPTHDPRRRRRSGNSRSAGRDPDRRAASGGHRQFRARSAGADGRGTLRRDPHGYPHARSRWARALPGDRAALARVGSGA